MRTNFYDLLTKREFDVQKEYSTLWYLFCEETCFASALSLSQWLNKYHFRNLPFRGSFTSLVEMMAEFGFRKRSSVDLDQLFLFCELIIAVLPKSQRDYPSNTLAQRKTILENVSYILEHTNHEIRQDQNNNSIVVEKNKSATMAAQLVTDASVAFELIEYNHFAIKGHLAEKKAILVSISGYIEPILNSKVLSAAGYKQLESDTGFVFNNFHIRHNNKEGSKANDYIASISDIDLEEWYDKAYELALSVIIINDYISLGKDIEDIKPKHTWRT